MMSIAIFIEFLRFSCVFERFLTVFKVFSRRECSKHGPRFKTRLRRFQKAKFRVAFWSPVWESSLSTRLGGRPPHPPFNVGRENWTAPALALGTFSSSLNGGCGGANRESCADPSMRPLARPGRRPNITLFAQVFEHFCKSRFQ